ncbi:hypothetical protein KY284_030076 [Solanum tuberosum]|nr:hypothetical protein KY284_030076 [Solanum tuberosum]
MTMQKDQATATKNNKTTGIDSILPSHKPLDIIVIDVAEEVVGGMEGRVQEIHTNLQDGVSKRGRELTHVLHEVMDKDHRIDSRAPATPISNQTKVGQHESQKENDMTTETGQQKDRPNNKSGERLSKKKRDVIKKRKKKSNEQEQGLTDKGQQTEEQVANKINKGRPIQDDYGALNSEDELDPDNQSINEYDEEEEETSNILIQDFGSTFHNE